MILIRPYQLLILLGTLFLSSCHEKNTEGEKLAKNFCGSCHLFPEPALLDKDTWISGVLPAMGRLAGVPQFDRHPFEESDKIFSRTEQMISTGDWQKIVAYYQANAPESLPAQSRPVVNHILSDFLVEKPRYGSPPLNTFLKIDPGNHWIYAGSMDSVLRIYDERLNLVAENSQTAIPVGLEFNQSLDSVGTRHGIVTYIGLMDPNDLRTGSAGSFTIDRPGTMIYQKRIDTLPRPVQVTSTDLDLDGRADYLVCGFGNHEGAFSWLKNNDEGGFEKRVLRPLPGAIRAIVEDVNRDGLPDIISLFAQGDEGIFLFVNKGSGHFETKAVLRFPPVNGSTFFEMVDFNGDGNKDILYTCGDNADHSPILKQYHGVYIYLNDGRFNFTNAFFFPLNGAFKALSRDFDKDGDLDIAAISYFPDTTNQPQEGFVYLQQSSAMKFTPAYIKEYRLGRWITLDAGDLDADGDEDIVIGSLYHPREAERMKVDVRSKPPWLLLRNTLRSR